MSATSIFFALLRDAGLPQPYAEYEFHHEKNWRTDYCWPDPEIMLALEVEGGVWQRKNGKGRHNRGSGFMKDMEKYNALATCGYRLIRTTPQNLNTTATINLVREAING